MRQAKVEAAVAKIAEIDRLIDENRAALMLRLHCMPESSWGWHTAWARCLDLAQVERQLFRARGLAQLERDTAEEQVYQAQQRSERAKQAAATWLERDLRRSGLRGRRLRTLTPGFIQEGDADNGTAKMA